VTRIGVGHWRVNFSTSMSTAIYAVSAIAGFPTTGGGFCMAIGVLNPTTTDFELFTMQSNAPADPGTPDLISCIVIGN
jgi:hypothetical protein